jgi:hypothetical protein
MYARVLAGAFVPLTWSGTSLVHLGEARPPLGAPNVTTRPPTVTIAPLIHPNTPKRPRVITSEHRVLNSKH